MGHVHPALRPTKDIIKLTNPLLSLPKLVEGLSWPADRTQEFFNTLANFGRSSACLSGRS